MGEYAVLFIMKMSAKSTKDLERKAESSAEVMSKCLKKKVVAYRWGELEKKDVVQTTLDGSG